MEVCTIIAKNYVAHARVLAESLRRHNPDSRLWTLIIDDFAGYIDPVVEPFEVLAPQDIGCEPFGRMAVSYTVLELSTAVKPWLLRHLMGATAGPVTYLDPDIRIYGSLARLDALASRHGAVVIPHNDRPIPSDGRKPTQVDIMLSGVFNLGYVSLAPGPEVDRLLDWWSERLRYDCRVDHAWGFFVDQRWFDLAPGFLSELAIVRDPQYNVAYWNLHSRNLERVGGHYTVDGEPLAFFHFSGFDPEHPLLLSHHQDRIDVVAHPVLERLLREYAAEVMGRGHGVSRHWPYSYAALGDGTKIDSTMRALYEEFADEQEARPVPSASPFTIEGAASFKQWLGAQAPDAPSGVSRALAGVYGARDDLRRAYSEVSGMDAEALLRWAEEFGRHEVPVLAWAGAPNGSSPIPHETSASPTRGPRPGQEEPSWREAPWGVNVVGFTHSDTETRAAASLAVRTLDSEGIAAVLLDGRFAGTALKIEPRVAPFAVNLICLGSNGLPRLGSEFGSGLLGGRYSVGLSLWPLGHVPQQLADSLSLIEELWVPSAHVRVALESHAPGPVETMPLPVQPLAHEPRSRHDLSLPDDKFLFLFSFDYLSGFERKNPLAVIDAFRAGFSSREDACLVLRTANSGHDSRSRALLRAAAGEDPRIRIIEDGETSASATSLMALCDCYVSLHRAEAFGLSLAEAMWLGKPVIATGYSGNLDFMTPENSMLVNYRLVPVEAGADPYPAGAEWADPSTEEATELMRRAYEDRSGARRIGARAREDIRLTNSPKVVGSLMSRRLQSIRAVGQPRRASEPARNLPPTLARLPVKLLRGADSPTRTGARRHLRRLVLRMMRPYTVYQESINRDLVTAVGEVNDQIGELRRELLAEHAMLLAELRRNAEPHAERARKGEEGSARVSAHSPEPPLKAPDAAGEV